MRYLISLFLILSISTNIKAQQDTSSYLTRHSVDFRKDLQELDYPVVGFTVIHGSAKAEDAEIALISSMLQKNDTLYYFPEIDCASAYYFNRYFETGDSELLKKQIINYGRRVPQEGGIAIYEKWVKLRELSKDKPIKVFGVDVLIDYSNYIDLLLEITTEIYPQRKLLELCNTELLAGTDIRNHIRTLVSGYKECIEEYSSTIKDPVLMDILMNDLANSFLDKNIVRRDSIIFENYVHQDQLFHFRKHHQFIRMGVYHMMKENFDNMYPGFLGILIDEEIYQENEIYSVLGILSDSEVLSEKTYNDTGKYTGFTTKSDGFYTGSEFFNSELLSKNALSDITFFPLGQKHSPFSADDFSILKNKTHWVPLTGKSTLDYIDAVILIKQSPANIPIEELK